jgi:SAM-dependent methyltransferase
VPRSTTTMTKNKDHWYDGWFYDRIIAPNQDELFAQIKKLIAPKSTVIDIGCGTGRLAFALGDHCESVVGIDLSKRNIDRAQVILQRAPNEKISFLHSNVTDAKSGGDKPFDYAIMTYVIHEVNKEERIKLLNDISVVADRIIIGDYLFPRPTGLSGFMSKTIEYLAGNEHYRNYRTYMADGGIHHLAQESGLHIIEEVKSRRSVDQIVVLAK